MTPARFTYLIIERFGDLDEPTLKELQGIGKTNYQAALSLAKVHKKRKVLTQKDKFFLRMDSTFWGLLLFILYYGYFYSIENDADKKELQEWREKEMGIAVKYFSFYEMLMYKQPPTIL